MQWSPLWWLLVFVVSQVLVYAARSPLKDLIRHAGVAAGGALRILARWSLSGAEGRRAQHEEAVRKEAQEQAHQRLEGELARVGENLARPLGALPPLQRQLEEGVERLTRDLNESAMVPPSPPGWTEAVERVRNIPDLGESSGKKILSEIKQHAVESEKKARRNHQAAVGERHKILSRLAHELRALRAKLKEAGSQARAATEAAARVDRAMAQCEALNRAEGGGARALVSSWMLFGVSGAVLAVAAGGAFVNFQLIALPMSELVPTGARVLGTPVSSIAALVIVLMEAAAGFFLMEALGFTELLPKLHTLTRVQRRLLLWGSFLAVLTLAAIEASLAILREHLVVADLELKRALSGGGGAPVGDELGFIPVLGQAVLGFMLPWLLAMSAIPLETFVRSGRHVVASVLTGLLGLFGVACRSLGRAVRSGAMALATMVDIYVAVPLWIETRFAARTSDHNLSVHRDAKGAPSRGSAPLAVTQRKEVTG